ncbi:hypothetical protein BMAFMH_B0908, partial [Burkholderia mallei FMH]
SACAVAAGFGLTGASPAPRSAATPASACAGGGVAGRTGLAGAGTGSTFSHCEVADSSESNSAASRGSRERNRPPRSGFHCASRCE